MNIREKFITFLWVLLVVSLFTVNFITNKYVLKADSVYEVYIDGKVIGYILDDDKLYELINNHQKEIKKKYGVDKVYPPESFKIIKTNVYDKEISTEEEIYNKIGSLDTFTIEGYTISIKSEDKTNYIYVLDKEIFETAINNFVLAFISSDEYDSYIEGTQEEIETTGKIIEKMYFDETITIKKSYVSVDDKIYTDASELTQYILFGDDYKIDSYTVKSGDTIASISDANKLNVQEFLIANPKYTSEESLLKIGDTVNITLINPIITFTYEVNEVADTEVPFEKKTEYDSSKPSDYNEITTPGVTGVIRATTLYSVKNGEMQSGAIVVDQTTITQKVDQITTKGKTAYYSPVTGSYVDTGDVWGWPTNYPYVLTSPYAYRWGSFHAGIDISGTGYNSPIYASLGGTVYSAGWEGKCGSGGGNCVVIAHPNGYYTIYAHLATINVVEGQSVSRGQVIGGMGSTGISTGTHLHFGVYYGAPYQAGSYHINPMSLWN